ncbi:hypothetical protein ABW21_db0200141 [Orbilia brochopaga]|nr:hypothetical protein ABW21_db0200141 [Drechslerella brochopaga]
MESTSDSSGDELSFLPTEEQITASANEIHHPATISSSINQEHSSRPGQDENFRAVPGPCLLPGSLPIPSDGVSSPAYPAALSLSDSSIWFPIPGLLDPANVSLTNFEYDREGSCASTLEQSVMDIPSEDAVLPLVFTAPPPPAQPEYGGFDVYPTVEGVRLWQLWEQDRAMVAMGWPSIFPADFEVVDPFLHPNSYDNTQQVIPAMSDEDFRGFWAQTVPNIQDLVPTTMSINELQQNPEPQEEPTVNVEEYFDFERFDNDTPEQVAEGMLEHMPADAVREAIRILTSVPITHKNDETGSRTQHPEG